jgi:Phosphotransferase enzyme family
LDGPTIRRDHASPLSPEAWQALRRDAEVRGRPLEGFHNRNYAVGLAAEHAAALGLTEGTPVKIRVRTGSVDVVERPWPDEGAVLDALRRSPAISGTPRHYAGHGGVSVHEYVPGAALSELCPPGKPLDPRHLDALTGQLASFTLVPAADLPPLPPGWAADGDSRTFLRQRAAFAEREVRQPYWPRFAALFEALEVPANALRALRDRVPALTPRPFALLHGDLHRHNVIVRPDGDLTVVDWELAMWGDPLHDLAIHLVRTRYPADQRAEAVDRWHTAVARQCPAAVAGLHRDLPVYVAYERAQSLLADTLRVAHGLLATAPHLRPGQVGAGVSRIRTALHLAAGPLRLSRVPTRTQVERALLGWLRDRGSRERRAA